MNDNEMIPSPATVRDSWSFQIPGVSAVATDALNGSIAGGDQALDLTATEAAAAYAGVIDADAPTPFTLSTSGTAAGYTNNWQLFPDVPAENDAVYFGAPVPFPELSFLVDAAGTAAGYNADSIIWEYYNGTDWDTELSVATHKLYDSTDTNDQDGDRSFQADGALCFIPPSDWAAVSPGSPLASGYWIRARLTATVDFSALPITDAVEHSIVTPTDGFKCPRTARIVGVRLINANTTAHTAADIKFILHNFTTGVHGDELTFAQDKRNERWDSTAFKTGGLAVAAGDVLGVVVTQEDTANELTNFTIEMDVTQ